MAGYTMDGWRQAGRQHLGFSHASVWVAHGLSCGCDSEAWDEHLADGRARPSCRLTHVVLTAAIGRREGDSPSVSRRSNTLSLIHFLCVCCVSVCAGSLCAPSRASQQRLLRCVSWCGRGERAGGPRQGVRSPPGRQGVRQGCRRPQAPQEGGR